MQHHFSARDREPAQHAYTTTLLETVNWRNITILHYFTARDRELVSLTVKLHVAPVHGYCP